MSARGMPGINSTLHYQSPDYNHLEPFCKGKGWSIKLTGIKRLVTCPMCIKKMREEKIL